MLYHPSFLDEISILCPVLEGQISYSFSEANISISGQMVQECQISVDQDLELIALLQRLVMILLGWYFYEKLTTMIAFIITK